MGWFRDLFGPEKQQGHYETEVSFAQPKKPQKGGIVLKLPRRKNRVTMCQEMMGDQDIYFRVVCPPDLAFQVQVNKSLVGKQMFKECVRWIDAVFVPEVKSGNLDIPFPKEWEKHPIIITKTQMNYL